MSSNPIFKDCVVAIAGDLDDYAWRDEKVRQWVLYWGGMFSNTVDDHITHLLCTEENFKKKISSVRVAIKNKSISIVTRDWLEDSINKKTRLSVLPYNLGERAREEKAKKLKIQRMEKLLQNAEDYIDERFWHVYRDSTYFEYQVQLKRDDGESGNVGEKHLLTLWESNAKPFVYQCTTLFSKQSRAKGRFPLNETPVDLKTGLKTFQAYFRKKTSIAWDDRIEKMGTTGPECFQYLPPSGGKPVGLVRGRPASIFGGDNNGNPAISSNQTAEQQHSHSPVDDIKSADVYNKRAREEDIADPTVTASDEQRPMKKQRHGGAEAACVPVGTEGGTAEEAIVIDSDSESSSEAASEPDIEPKGNVQPPTEPANNEAAQGGENGHDVESPPKFKNITQDLEDEDDFHTPPKFKRIMDDFESESEISIPPEFQVPSDLDGAFDAISQLAAADDDDSNEHELDSNSSTDYGTAEHPITDEHIAAAAAKDPDAHNEESTEQPATAEDGDEAPRENTEDEAAAIEQTYADIERNAFDDFDYEYDTNTDDSTEARDTPAEDDDGAAELTDSAAEDDAHEPQCDMAAARDSPVEPIGRVEETLAAAGAGDSEDGETDLDSLHECREPDQ